MLKKRAPFSLSLAQHTHTHKHTHTHTHTHTQTSGTVDVAVPSPIRTLLAITQYFYRRLPIALVALSFMLLFCTSKSPLTYNNKAVLVLCSPAVISVFPSNNHASQLPHLAFAHQLKMDIYESLSEAVA